MKRAMKRIMEPKVKEVKRCCREVYNDELQKLYSSSTRMGACGWLTIRTSGKFL
jgi:hypothetical protein